LDPAGSSQLCSLILDDRPWKEETLAVWHHRRDFSRRARAAYQHSALRARTGDSARQDDTEGQETSVSPEAVAPGSIGHVQLNDRDFGDLRDLVEAEYRRREGDLERLKDSLTLRLKHVDARMTRLTNLLVYDVIDQSTFNARKPNTILERRGILEELERSEERSDIAPKRTHASSAIVRIHATRGKIAVP
jgi:hypothetical protein